MRITSELFVSQLTRRVFAEGGFAAVVRRGSDMAGAVFVLTRARDGTLTLYGPAPQIFADEEGGRRFIREAVEDEADLQTRFEREARFDPDFWVVELERDEVGDLLDLVEDEPRD